MNRIDVLMLVFVLAMVGCAVWVAVSHGLLPVALAVWCWVIVTRLATLRMRRVV